MNKKLFSGKNIAIGIITLIIGVFAAVGIARAFSFQTTTVSGNIVSFILNPAGKVDGAILDTNDQVHFGGQTGELVTAQVKIGDNLSATGYLGSSSTFGREFHAKTLQIGDQTITVAGGKTHHEKGGRDEKGDKGKRPHPPKKGEKPEMINDETPNAETVAPAETAKATSNVRFVLVSRNGETRGLILADGTQTILPKEVKDAGLTFSEATNVTVEGEIAKSEFGNFIKPTTLTIDNQTFSFNR